MLRFTIRDVLWLTVVVAFAVCWYLEREGRVAQRATAEHFYRENAKLFKELEFNKRRADVYENQSGELQKLLVKKMIGR